MKSFKPTRKLPAIVAACAIAAAADAALAATASVTVNNTAVGVTPRYLGFNMGHYLPGSNTTAWLQYSGANGYRVWASATDYEGSDDNGTYGDNVNTLEDFNERKALLRNNPESTTYINWDLFNSNFQNKTQSGRNHVRLNEILGGLKSSGVEPILNLTRSESYDYTGWGGKWEQWQFTYAMAYHAAKNYDVQRFQWYNEPDQNASTITIPDYADRLRTTADAFRAAVEDVNRIHGKSLVADVSAPTTKDGASKIDQWGKPILEANRTDYAGNPSPVDIFNTYDLHRYNSLGSSFAADIDLLSQKIPQYNPSGKMMPVTYTEFNRYNTSTFSGRTDSLDTPTVFTEYANDYIGAMSRNVKGMYAFKFSQTVWTDPGFDEPMKTGHYYVQDFGLNDITGVTQGAEVAKLMAKGFKNERPRLGHTASASAGNYDTVASFDAGKGNYHFLTSNRTAGQYDVTLNLSAWNVAAGQIVAVNEVSDLHHGSVPQFLTVPANKIVTFSQPQRSVWMLTVPQGTNVQQRVDLNPTADAKVSNANPLLNYGLDVSAHVARSVSSNADEASYLKFNLGQTAKSTVSRAFLQLTGSNIASAEASTMHVYGIFNDSWNELTLNWSNAPDLTGASDAKLKNVGTDAFPVGQLTWNSQVNQWGIDVTEFVRKHPDANLSFVLIREERFLGDGDAARVQLNTREAASGKPTLSMFLYDKPVHFWNRNAAGNFAASANWDVNSAPNFPGAVAVMGDFLTAAQTVTMDAARTIGELRFDSHHAYTIAGNATITLNGGSGQASKINVHKGGHTISAPIAIATPLAISLDAGTGLKLAGAIGGGKVSSLSVSAGAGAGATLDVTTNSLIVAGGNVGSATGGTYNGLSGLIQSGLNGEGGIMTSAPDAVSSLTTLGIATASQTGKTSFRGVSLSGSDVLIMYTYAGDANLDGAINADDYANIDFNAAGASASGYHNGDFNYDGAINADDYSLIDFNNNAQGAPFNTASLSVVAVPEPTACGFAALAAAMCLRRRRRSLR